MHLILAIALALLTIPASSAAAQCTAASGERRVPLLELYTSEGCDSCPPVDRWVSGLQSRGYATDRVVVLAYHVDYWDYIGWRDPYAQARFSERQRVANARSSARFVYTPQLMLNGKDYRRGTVGDDFAARLAEISRAPAKASIRLALIPAADRLSVSGAWSAPDVTDARQAQGWVALYENRLATDVRAGENRGKRLEHDFVVRDLAGPFPAGALAHTFHVDGRWKQAELGVAAFVHDVRSGDALQALTLAVCRS